jgi:hypothetical protein
MIRSPNKIVKFSVTRKKMPNYTPDKSDRKIIKFFSETILEHFSMSEDLAKAIGTVVVQALTENAKDNDSGDMFGGGDDFGFGDDMGGDSGDDFGLDLDFDESELPESSRDAGRVQEAEGPKAAPDLSEDFAELKRTVNNHSVTFADTYRDKRKDFFSYSAKSFLL